MIDKEINRIIKANIKMAGFISLVNKMRKAQKSADGIEELEFECKEIEREVDEWLEKLNKYEKRN